jgi:hypothetical protein
MFFLPDGADIPVLMHFFTPVEEKMELMQQNTGK